MRLDFWFFQGYLLGMGTLNEKGDHSHKAIQLAVSWGKPMVVTVGDEIKECSLLAVDSQVIHRIDGSRGWQFFGYLHPESHLGKLVKEKINQTGDNWYSDDTDLADLDPNGKGMDMEFSSYRIRELWESLLSRFLGISSYSLGWSRELREVLDAIRRLPRTELNIRNLSRELDLAPGKLEERFFQMAGIPLVHLIFNTKLVYASDLTKKGKSLEEAVALSGLTGVASAASYMDELYGLDLEHLLTEKPHVRFYSAADYEQLSGHAT